MNAEKISNICYDPEVVKERVQGTITIVDDTDKLILQN